LSAGPRSTGKCTSPSCCCAVNYVIPGDGAWRFDLGGDLITGTGVHTGHWRALQALGTGATLDAGTAATDLGGTLAGVAIPAGTIVHGRFTAVQLSAGSCLAYQ
jgi:hypothetical protein